MSIPTYILAKRSLQTVQGMKLKFEKSPVQLGCLRFEIPKNQPLIRNKVDKVLKKGAVVECEQKAVEYVSSIFLTEKTHGTQ